MTLEEARDGVKGLLSKVLFLPGWDLTHHQPLMDFHTSIHKLAEAVEFLLDNAVLKPSLPVKRPLSPEERSIVKEIELTANAALYNDDLNSVLQLARIRDIRRLLDKLGRG